MSRRKNLVAYDGTVDAVDAPHDDEVEAGQPLFEEPLELDDTDEVPWADEQFDEAPARSLGWVTPVLASLVILGWSVFFGWAHRAAFAPGTTPAQATSLVADWAIPVVLVVGLWILALRNSRREARRFGETARMLSEESSALELRLGAVNRELSLARDFIAAQSRDLESLGRVASERLSSNADRLQDLIRNNSDQVDAIGQVSDHALGNMDRLRDQLPVLSNAARDLANQIGGAGNTAKEQLDDMIAGFDRLNKFGSASARQVDALRARVADTLGALEQQIADIEGKAGERFDMLREQDEDLRVRLEARETDTLAAIRRRAEEMAESIAAQAALLDQSEAEALNQLGLRMAALREEGTRLIASLREGQGESEALWNKSVDAMHGRLQTAIQDISRIDMAAMDNAQKKLDGLTRYAQETDRRVVESFDNFENEFARRRDQADLRENEAMEALQARIAAFDDAVGERQRAHVEHIESVAARGETLVGRIAELDVEMARLAGQGSEEGARLAEASELLAERVSHSRALLEESGSFVGRLTDDSIRLLEIIRAAAEHSEGALGEAIGSAEGRLKLFGERAGELRETIGEAEERGARLVEHMRTAQAGTGETDAALATLDERLAALASKTEALAETARGDLQDAIAELEAVAGRTIGKLREDQAAAVREIAERIGSEGTGAIEKALREGSADAIAGLEEAARQASERGRDTAVQLRDQLAMVNELAGNLEQRVAQAREQAEERLDHDFTRRMALITESLNSTSIDISKAFDNEVTDTAWASYLRGDRGIFTRRAVRLLDNSEARAVIAIYEEDSDFRETVNRYIHDFEAMLRNILSTRDGNAMAVTMLSSDMGKLYVALAQAIERLRN